MLLTIDVGNTNTVLGVFEGETLLVHWRLTTRREQTADEYGILVRNLLGSSDLDPEQVDAVGLPGVRGSMRSTSATRSSPPPRPASDCNPCPT